MREVIALYTPLILIAFISAFSTVALFVPRLRKFAIRIKAVQEGGGRFVHSGLMPNIGGIAIFTGFIIALTLASIFKPALIDSYRVELLAIVLGAAIMTLVGFIDDIWEVPPILRLASQTMAASILIVNGIQVGFITNYFNLNGPEYLFFSNGLSVIITLLWVVGFTNAFNFIDGLDGLSSGISTIASFSLLAVAVQFPDRGVAILLLTALAGSSLGFLRHNFSPAIIIMGDSGAYMIGYVLAAVSVLGALKVTAVVTVAAPIMILALPVLNITQVTLRRLSRGSNPTVAANDHLHDLIRVQSGSKQLTVVILWILALALGALGMMLSNTPVVLIYLTIVLTVVSIAIVSALRYFEAKKELQIAGN